MFMEAVLRFLWLQLQSVFSFHGFMVSHFFVYICLSKGLPKCKVCLCILYTSLHNFFSNFLVPIIGLSRLCRDLKFMLGFVPGYYWQVTWGFCAPVILSVSINRISSVFGLHELNILMKIPSFPGYFHLFLDRLQTSYLRRLRLSWLGRCLRMVFEWFIHYPDTVMGNYHNNSSRCSNMERSK